MLRNILLVVTLSCELDINLITYPFLSSVPINICEYGGLLVIISTPLANDLQRKVKAGALPA